MMNTNNTNGANVIPPGAEEDNHNYNPGPLISPPSVMRPPPSASASASVSSPPSFSHHEPHQQMMGAPGGGGVAASSSQLSPQHSQSLLGEQQQQQGQQGQRQGEEEEDLNVFVSDLLDQMTGKFEHMGKSILGRIDDMGDRIDQLEHSISDLLHSQGLGDDSEPHHQGGAGTSGIISGTNTPIKPATASTDRNDGNYQQGSHLRTPTRKHDGSGRTKKHQP